MLILPIELPSTLGLTTHVDSNDLREIFTFVVHSLLSPKQPSSISHSWLLRDCGTTWLPPQSALMRWDQQNDFVECIWPVQVVIQQAMSTLEG